MSSGANFVSYMVGGRLDPPFMPTKTRPYIVGNRIESRGIGRVESTMQVSHAYELLSNGIFSWAVQKIEEDNVFERHTMYFY